MNSLLVICGPTATGKTSLAVSLAKTFNGEIVNADSRQVYRGMDIGTGKDIPPSSRVRPQAGVAIPTESENPTGLLRRFTPRNDMVIGYREKDSVPIWLVDVVDPDYPFNVSEYVRCAQQVVADIQSRGAVPILVGGSGFYIKALLDPPPTLHIPANALLRKRLDGMTATQLQEEMSRLDDARFRRMNESDRNNPRRLVRAIEIAFQKGLTFSQKGQTLPVHRNAILTIGLTAPLPDLYQRIDERVEKRCHEGAVDEILSLLKRGYSWDLPSFSGCGYSVWQSFFEERATMQETVERWKYQEHAYARRQLTWFRKQADIQWFDITREGYEKKVRKTGREWYTKMYGNKS